VSEAEDGVQCVLDELREARVVQRIWEHDYTVWKPDPSEISDRLGWLDLPETMVPEIPRLEAFAKSVRSEGVERILLLGMGGSSLAAEMYARVFGPAEGHPRLTVLDTTDPTAIAALTGSLQPDRSLYVVATKSGTTTETLALFRHVFTTVSHGASLDAVGNRFVAITDPGSPLVDVARRHRFRETFLNAPNLGGRYSALSHFGLVPAALLGIDVGRLLESAARAQHRSAPEVPTHAHPGARLGAQIATHARQGRDKLTFLLPERLQAFGDWVEQLIAESTGKEGTGILPVVSEPVGSPVAYGTDRLFVRLRSSDDPEDTAGVAALRRHGHPVLQLSLDDRYELGGQLFVWEFAVAILGALLGINPFDQPDVEESKRQAREMVAAYRRTGALPACENVEASPQTLREFVDGAQPGGYVSLHAYVPPSATFARLLRDLCSWVRGRTRCATTFGFGPRFLHSTGQLHKGDAGRGRFIQLTCDTTCDLAIPDEAGSSRSSISFGVLKAAQALGDAQALRNAGRPVLRVRLGRAPQEQLIRLLTELRVPHAIGGKNVDG